MGISKNLSLGERITIWRNAAECSEKGCWLARGVGVTINPTGYARVKFGRKQHALHRLSYQYFKGVILDGKVLDHLCRERACFNPDHLEAVTQRVNVQRGLTGQHLASRTHCVHGHEYTPSNTGKQKAGRFCRACRRVDSMIRHRKARGWDESRLAIASTRTK